MKLCAFAILLTSTLTACTSRVDAPPATHVGVAGATEFLAIAAFSPRDVVVLACPATTSADARLACGGSGLDFAADVSSVDLLVKAREHLFVRQNVTGAVDLDLPALAAAASTPDYARGFAATGESAFLDFAYRADTELGTSWSVKFYIADVQTTPKVYFQNTRKHPLHYTFAHDVLGVPGNVSAFEAATYHGADRQAMAGTLVYYPDLHPHAAALPGDASGVVALTFFPSDDATPAQVARAHGAIEEVLGFVPLTGGHKRLVYVPAGSTQEAQAVSAPEPLLRQGVPVLTRTELYGGLKQQLLNPGVAFGKLQRIDPDTLAHTPVSRGDVLVLTRLPNQAPLVGGTITEELQTPLAHVNVAAHTRGAPNMALLNAGSDPRIAPLLGKFVRFEVGKGVFTLREATLEEAQAYWTSQARPLYVPPHDDDTSDLRDFAQLGFADSIRVGVKAANLAEMTHVLPDNTPKGFAVPFHYYAQFMATGQATTATCDAARTNCTDEGRTAAICDAARALCLPAGVTAEVLTDHVGRLLADETFATDTALREAALDNLNAIMAATAIDPQLATDLDARVTGLAGTANVKLRSSTNSEDLPDFSGAGLYESYTATGAGSKAAHLRIRLVWASVWTFRAFEEREFWHIDHKAVRMGVLVQPSFPDEQANGVLITQNLADPNTVGYYVNVQKGEESVTNPTGGELAEIFSILPSPTGLQVARSRFSSLSPDVPLLTLPEVTALFAAAYKVQQHFAPLYGKDPSLMALDMEFKFHGPERKLFLKQVRPYHQ